MPLISCPECGRSVSTDALVCPHCGFPMHNRSTPVSPRAKKWIGIAVAVAVVMVIGGGFAFWQLARWVDRQAAAEQQRRTEEELVDFVDLESDSAPADEAAGSELPATSPASPDRPESPQASSGERESPPDEATYELSAVTQMPVLLNRAEIAERIERNYPPLLRDAGVTGNATVRMRVLEDGSVDRGSIMVESATHDDFGVAASRVATLLRFRPAEVDGKRVKVWVMLPVQFQIVSP